MMRSSSRKRSCATHTKINDALAGLPRRFRSYGQEVQPFNQRFTMRHSLDASAVQETRKAFSSASRGRRTPASAALGLTTAAAVAAVSLLSAEIVYSKTSPVAALEQAPLPASKPAVEAGDAGRTPRGCVPDAREERRFCADVPSPFTVSEGGPRQHVHYTRPLPRRVRTSRLISDSCGHSGSSSARIQYTSPFSAIFLSS